MKRKTTKSKVRYSDESLGHFEVIPDFLPKPWELAEKEKKTKITISLNDSSVNFFKKQAKKYHTPYQAMIRNLLQAYAERAEKR